MRSFMTILVTLMATISWAEDINCDVIEFRDADGLELYTIAPAGMTIEEARAQAEIDGREMVFFESKFKAKLAHADLAINGNCKDILDNITDLFPDWDLGIDFSVQEPSPWAKDVFKSDN